MHLGCGEIAEAVANLGKAQLLIGLVHDDLTGFKGFIFGVNRGAAREAEAIGIGLFFVFFTRCSASSFRIGSGRAG